MEQNNKSVFWDSFNSAFVVYHSEFSRIAFPEESLWGLCKSIWTSVGVVQHRFECFVDRFGTTRKILQCSLGTFGSRFQHLGTCCRLLWHHPKNASVRFWKIRKSRPALRNLLSTASAYVSTQQRPVRRVCGARARTSWSFLPSFQSPGAAAAPPRRDLKWRQFSHRGFFKKRK